MAAFLNFSPSGRDTSEGAGGGNSFFPQPARLRQTSNGGEVRGVSRQRISRLSALSLKDVISSGPVPMPRCVAPYLVTLDSSTRFWRSQAWTRQALHVPSFDLDTLERRAVSIANGALTSDQGLPPVRMRHERRYRASVSPT